MAERRIRELQRRLERLDAAYLFEHEVDRLSYLPLRDKLRDDLRGAEAAGADARLEDVDLDVALAASEQVLSNAAELWRAGTLEQRQKLQGALFPMGLVHDGENFRTAVTCIALSQLQHETGKDDDLASPTGLGRLWTVERLGFLRVA